MLLPSGGPVVVVKQLTSRLLLAAVALWALQGGAHALPPTVLRVLNGSEARAPLPPKVVKGEHYRFSVGYLGMIGARAAVHVEQPEGGDTVLTADVENTWVLRFIFRIRDRFQAVVDPHAGRTLTTRLWQNENGRQRYREESFFEDRVVSLERSARGERVHHVKVGTRPMDPLSSLFWLRGQALHNGDVLTGPIFANNRVFEARVKVVGRERVRALGRNWNAVKLYAEFFREGAPVNGVHGTFWLSDDDARVPLKAVADTTYGKVNFTLERMSR